MRRVMHRGLAALLLAAACRTQGPETPTTPSEHVLTPEGAHHPTSAFSPDGKRVAYWAAGDSAWELRLAAADLSSPRVLSNDRGWSEPILWSPDGKLIAFTSSATSFGDVWVIAPDSGAGRQLTHASGFAVPQQWYPRAGVERLAFLATERGGALKTSVVDVAPGTPRPMLPGGANTVGFWSPDGSRIAYQVSETSKSTLWLADSGGTNPQPLTSEGLEQFGGTASPWSPDGRHLLYMSRRTGLGDIWSVSVPDGATRQLTHDIRNDYNPVWSPDGKWIAFLSERGRQTDVWIMPDTGGEARRVTDDDAVETNVQWVGPATLAFQTGRRTGTLSLIRVADGSERPLTTDSTLITSFDVSPDGRDVVYGVERGGGVSEIQVRPLAGGPARTVVPGSNDNGDPYWSPDGKAILFYSDRSGNADLWVVDATGGNPRALTNWPTDEVDGEWAADSKSVYFLSGRATGTTFWDLYQVPISGGQPKRLTSTGTILNVEPSRGSNDVFITGIGKTAGRFVLSRVKPDGSIQTIWDKNNVNGLSHRRISPTGDSVAVQLDEPGGGFSSVIISVHDGKSHPILDKQETAGAWSPDGKQLLYYFGSPNSDLGVLDLATGAKRRLTTTPESEGSTQWTPDGTSVVVLRSFPKRRIATVDVARLLSGKP